MRQKLPASPTPPPGCCRLHSQEQNPTHRRKWSTTSAIGRRHVAHPASHTATEPVKQASSPSKHRGSAGMCRRRRRRLNKTSRARASERARVRASELVCTSCCSCGWPSSTYLVVYVRPSFPTSVTYQPWPPERLNSTSVFEVPWQLASPVEHRQRLGHPNPNALLISSLPGAILPSVSHKCGIELPKQRNTFCVNAG